MHRGTSGGGGWGTVGGRRGRRPAHGGAAGGARRPGQGRAQGQSGAAGRPGGVHTRLPARSASARRALQRDGGCQGADLALLRSAGGAAGRQRQAQRTCGLPRAAVQPWASGLAGAMRTERGLAGQQIWGGLCCGEATAGGSRAGECHPLFLVAPAACQPTVHLPPRPQREPGPAPSPQQQLALSSSCLARPRRPCASRSPWTPHARGHPAAAPGPGGLLEP